LNKVVEAFAYMKQIVFSYYDHRLIPENILDFLFKNYTEVYRRYNSVLFKFNFNTDDIEYTKFFSWILSLETGDEFKLIILDDDNESEEFGCSDDFNLRLKKTIFYTNDSQINNNPCELKALILNDEDRFDQMVKKRGL
jgi:hypothetical protein